MGFSAKKMAYAGGHMRLDIFLLNSLIIRGLGVLMGATFIVKEEFSAREDAESRLSAGMEAGIGSGSAMAGHSGLFLPHPTQFNNLHFL